MDHTDWSEEMERMQFNTWLFLEHPLIFQVVSKNHQQSNKDYIKKRRPDLWKDYQKFLEEYPYRGYQG